MSRFYGVFYVTPSFVFAMIPGPLVLGTICKEVSAQAATLTIVPPSIVLVSIGILLELSKISPKRCKHSTKARRIGIKCQSVYFNFDRGQCPRILNSFSVTLSIFPSSWVARFVFLGGYHLKLKVVKQTSGSTNQNTNRIRRTNQGPSHHGNGFVLLQPEGPSYLRFVGLM